MSLKIIFNSPSQLVYLNFNFHKNEAEFVNINLKINSRINLYHIPKHSPRNLETVHNKSWDGAKTKNNIILQSQRVREQFWRLRRLQDSLPCSLIYPNQIWNVSFRYKWRSFGIYWFTDTMKALMFHIGILRRKSSRTFPAWKQWSQKSAPECLMAGTMRYPVIEVRERKPTYRTDVLKMCEFVF